MIFSYNIIKTLVKHNEKQKVWTTYEPQDCVSLHLLSNKGSSDIPRESILAVATKFKSKVRNDKVIFLIHATPLQITRYEHKFLLKNFINIFANL